MSGMIEVEYIHHLVSISSTTVSSVLCSSFPPIEPKAQLAELVGEPGDYVLGSRFMFP